VVGIVNFSHFWVCVFLVENTQSRQLYYLLYGNKKHWFSQEENPAPCAISANNNDNLAWFKYKIDQKGKITPFLTIIPIRPACEPQNQALRAKFSPFTIASGLAVKMRVGIGLLS